uniref:Uncharacterized protein n=1 Tax=Oryza brachyantha TaxID=4533 RepID=J3LVW8_ORYBR
MHKYAYIQLFKNYKHINASRLIELIKDKVNDMLHFTCAQVALYLCQSCTFSN